MNKKEFNEIIRHSQNEVPHKPLTLFLKKCFPKMSIKQGCSVWWLLENRDLIVDGKDISGSFRYNGACIAGVVGKGTDYLHFYCSHPQSHYRFKLNKDHSFTEKFALKQLQIIKKNGGKFKTGLHVVPLECYKQNKNILDYVKITYFYCVQKIISLEL